MNPTTGRVVRVLLDTINGRPIDGPNDLVLDANGGLYIIDLQFTPEARKSRPGNQVYYLAADGRASVVVGPGEYTMPDGLTPTGRSDVATRTGVQIFLPKVQGVRRPSR